MQPHFLRSVLLAALALVIVGSLSASNLQAKAIYDSDIGRPESVSLTPSGEDTSLNDTGSDYLSPINKADSPFTHMLLRWEASGPVSGTLEMEVRSSLDGKDWQAWAHLHEDPHLWMPEDGEEVHWSEITYAGEGARFWQVRAHISASAEGERPVLRRIDVHTVDGRFAEDQPSKARTDSTSLASASKPPVVSRTAWGNPDGQSSRVSPAYYPVSHMVVHHTADPNSFRGGESSWGDRVRAIWSFHTFTRGWGDIGYNFLIDPNGTIYEGRSGGDDAVGFHDTGNYGSMGVSLVGTYSSASPPAAMQESLVSLLAWKSEQKGIDPLGRSYYYGCDISSYCRNAGAVSYNISGHRDINPTTSCPGDMAFNLLPSIRNRVRERIIGGPVIIPDNGDMVVDELENSFARSDANWNSARCGYGGHTFYTYAANDADGIPDNERNSATWRPNIPQDGRYSVYASIPQGCGLSSNPPYASTQTRYFVSHANGGTWVGPFDHNTADEWVDLGAYDFKAGTDGAVELYDRSDESLSEQKVIFFDSVKWVPVEEEGADVELVNVSYEKTTVQAGGLLKATFTIRNRGEVAVQSQNPEAGTTPEGAFDTANSYVYDEGECFLGAEQFNYPAYPKETERFRVTLGATNRTPTCDGETGGYPWRWGINGPLEPGETRDVVGYVRFRTPGEVTLRAGLIEEYVRYHGQDAGQTTITVVQEGMGPVLASYDSQLQPQAHVYRLGDIPDNLLARTRNPLSITRGEYVGSFPWDGSLIEWGDMGGPLDVSDSFLVEQTRTFFAPTSGEYTFRTVTDDGSWLWIDGQEVVTNFGLQASGDQLDHAPEAPDETTDATGTITLDAGLHVLSFKYFERTSAANVRYDVRLPGAAAFTAVPDGFASGARLGNTFLVTPSITLAAGDLGGVGVQAFRYSLNGSETIEQETTDGLLRLGQVVSGTYTLRYSALDSAGNESRQEVLTFAVNPDLPVQRVYLPLVQR